MGKPDENDVRRLALIRYLFRRAKEQTEAPEPLAATAILSLHDAAEWFLHLVAEHLDASPPHGFMEYWQQIEDASGVSLTGKASLRRLNGARKELKHRAVFPSASDVGDFAGGVETFLEENCMKVFNVSLQEISLVQLVRPVSARERLEKAEEFRSQEDYDGAVREAAAAFEVVFSSADLLGLGRRGNRLVGFGHGLDSLAPKSFPRRTGSRDQEDPRLDEFAERLERVLKPMETAIQTLGAGINYQRFLRFKTVVPARWDIDFNGNLAYAWTGSPQSPSRDDAEFCIDFVIETALALEPYQEREIRSDTSDRGS